MNAHARIASATLGFGSPDTIDPHRFEVHIPPGNAGQVRIVEHYGVASSVFGRPLAERCVMSRAAWRAIREDVKRSFNERLKEKQLASGAWEAGVNKVERLLGQELIVLAWAVEAADTALIPTAVRNWLALRPEERWWLYAVTAASTGEAKHAEIGWRKALRFALTENPVREALVRSKPNDEGAQPGKAGRRKPRKPQEAGAPLFPGFEEEAFPLLMATPKANGVREDLNASSSVPKERALVDRARDTGAKNLRGGAKGKKGSPKSNAHGAGLVLEGKKAPRPRQGVRAGRAAARDR